MEDNQPHARQCTRVAAVPQCRCLASLESGRRNARSPVRPALPRQNARGTRLDSGLGAGQTETRDEGSAGDNDYKGRDRPSSLSFRQRQ